MGAGRGSLLRNAARVGGRLGFGARLGSGSARGVRGSRRSRKRPPPQRPPEGAPPRPLSPPGGSRTVPRPRWGEGEVDSAGLPVQPGSSTGAYQSLLRHASERIWNKTLDICQDAATELGP